MVKISPAQAIRTTEGLISLSAEPQGGQAGIETQEEPLGREGKGAGLFAGKSSRGLAEELFHPRASSGLPDRSQGSLVTLLHIVKCL